MLERRPNPTLRDRATAWLPRAGWASLVANVVIVCTGGAVRLTGSGLGCPTWPRCTEESFTPHAALNIHSAIEFGNRLLTFALVVVAVVTVLVAFLSVRRDLRRLSVLLALGIPAQAVIGGISVLTDLNPWVVSLHLIVSLTMIAASTLFLWKVRHPDGAPGWSGPVAWAGWSTYAAGWAVLYVGTVVTGAGPHAGDLESRRNGLSTEQTSQLHADLVFLFVGLTIGLLFALHATRAPAAAIRAARILLAVELAQGVIGFVQYFTDLPILLVGLHMLGAATIAAVMTWALLQVRTVHALSS